MNYAKALRLAREELAAEMARNVLRYSRIRAIRDRITYFEWIIATEDAA